MRYFVIFLAFIFVVAIATNQTSYAQCAYDPNLPHKSCDDVHATLVIEPHEAQIENIDGQLFHVIGHFALEQESDDRIRLNGVTFTHPSYPNPPTPGGPVSVTVTFESGAIERIYRVGSPSPFVEFVGVDPQAGVRRNVDGSFDFLLSVKQQSIFPLKQFNAGITMDEIQCKESSVLVAKHDNSPACVKPETKIKLIERGWTNHGDVSNMLSSQYAGFSDVEKLLVENNIDYLKDKLVVTVGPSIRGDPGCGAVVDADSETHWFGIDSVSNPTKMTLYSENPQQCVVNTGSCFCNAQIELTSLTLDELIYFNPTEQEKYAEILIDYLYDQNINRTPKFQIGNLNLNYTDSSAIGYCGHIWGTNTYGFFSGAIVDDVVEDYRIDQALPLLCAISDDAKWWENEN